MDDFPQFMKSPANRIAMSSHATPGVEGWLFDGADGNQMTFWTCHGNATAAAHVHEFDEYMVVVRGCYTLILSEKRVTLGPGQEYFIPKGRCVAARSLQAHGRYTRLEVDVWKGRRHDRHNRSDGEYGEAGGGGATG